MRLILVVLALALAGCSGGSTPPTPVPVPVPVTVASWTIGPLVGTTNYSVNMPLNPTPDGAGGFYFDFPAAPGSVHGMTTPPVGATRTKMIAVFSVSGDGQAVSTQDPTGDGYVTMYFQRTGDNWSGAGVYASYRWYSPGHSVALVPGDYTVEIPFDPAEWSGVMGGADPVGFGAAVADMANIGFAFGNPSQGATAHGVQVVNGGLRFMLKSFTLQ
jgi:hypothetical protein